MKHYLTTENKFIDLRWFEAENKTMIIKSLDFKTTKAFYLERGDYLNDEDFEEDKEFVPEGERYDIIYECVHIVWLL